MASSKGNWFRQLQIIFYAMLLGQLLLALAAWFIIRAEAVNHFMDSQNDLLLLGGYGLAMIVGAIFIDRLRSRKGSAHLRLRDRAPNNYRNTVIIRLAVVVSATLLLTAIAIFTDNYEPLALIVLLLGAYFYLRPSMDEFTERYGKF